MEKCGVLLPVFSLPSAFGIGSFGEAAFRFIDFLQSAGQDFWQVLPLCPTGYGDSPYQSTSAFAGNMNFIDLRRLTEQGYLKADELHALEQKNTGRVDYRRCCAERKEILKSAYERFLQRPPETYAAFVAAESDWLNNFALFMALKDAFAQKSWENWDAPYRRFDSEQVRSFAASHEKETGFYKFTQFVFDEQWKRVRAYANAAGIEIIGDVPIYVAYDSADVWANPELFLLNEERKSTLVAGVPPDAFTEDGQLWGNPVYDWAHMKEDGFSWWEKRLRKCVQLYDYVRIDHFRGFESFYAVEAGRRDAKVGEWKKGPGIALFDALNRKIKNMKIIAEDLGFLDEDVREMVRRTGYPGMKVLQFGLDGNPENEYLPRNYPENCIAYTGTHDNDTSRGFYRSLSFLGKRAARRALRCGFCRNFVKAMIVAVLNSRAKYVVVPMQDYLDEGGDCRINVPGTVGGTNWQYRLKEIPSRKTAKYMRSAAGRENKDK